MIIFCDGSSEVLPKGRAEGWILSWGLKIEHGEDGAELCGHRFVKLKHSGCHEIVAFIEAVIYASAHGSKPEQTSFFTDDQAVAFGQNWFNMRIFDAQPHLSAPLEAFFVKASTLYPAETIELARGYALHSRFTWVKGHHHTVNNLRADYLAAIGRKLGLGYSTELLSFEDWLEQDMLRYKAPARVERWNPPFSWC